jgi:hypothetical protein
MRRKAAGVLGLLASLVLLAPVTAGCAGKPERTFTRPADLPTAQQVSVDNSVVEVGAWGVLRMPGTAGDTGTDVIAVKVTAVDHGEPGALGDVQLLNSPGGGQSRLADAVPYFVSYDYAVLVGNRISSTPMHWLYATTDTGTDDIDTLSLPDSVEECRTPGDEEYPPDLGYARHGCLTAVARNGAVPTQLVFDVLTNGSRGVTFRLPVP